MSINDPEQRHSTNPDVAHTTADLKALHARDAVTPPEQHRDDRELKAKKRRRRMIGGAVVAGVAAIPGVVLTAVIVGGLSGEKTATEPQEQPGTSASADPGETDAPNPEVGGVTLTAEQLEALSSGDEEAEAKVINDAIVSPLSERMFSYSAGDADNFDITDLVSDPQVQEDILNTLRTHWPDFDEKREQGLQTVSFCEANVIDPEAFGSRCEDRFSVMHVDEPVTLDAARSLFEEGTFAEIPEDDSNLAATRPEFNFKTIYLSLDGDRLSLSKH